MYDAASGVSRLLPTLWRRATEHDRIGSCQDGHRPEAAELHSGGHEPSREPSHRHRDREDDALKEVGFRRVEAPSPLDTIVSALGLTEALIAAATVGLADQFDEHLQQIESIRLRHRDALGGVQLNKGER